MTAEEQANNKLLAINANISPKKWLCRVALPGWSPILPELEKQFMTEFDYRNEASNLQSVRENMLSSPYKQRVKVPEPIVAFSTKNVLLMEKLDGEKLVSSAERKLSKALQGDDQLAKSLMGARKTGKTIFLTPIASFSTNVKDYT